MSRRIRSFVVEANPTSDLAFFSGSSMPLPVSSPHFSGKQPPQVRPVRGDGGWGWYIPKHHNNPQGRTMEDCT